MKRQMLYVSLGLGLSLFEAQANEPDTVSHLIIRSIRISGNNVTRPQVILREMSLHNGDTLFTESLLRDRDRIYSLGLFNKVTITHTDSAVFTELLVTVVERWYIFPYPIVDLTRADIRTLSYGFGVTHQNFLGRDEKISASFNTGYDKAASLTYQNPRLTDDDDIFLRTSLSYRDSHSLDNASNILFEQINRIGSLSVGKRFGLFQTLIGTAGYQMWEIPDTSLGRTVSRDGTDRFAELALHYTYDGRNVREYPTDGVYFDVVATNDGLRHESTIHTLTSAGDIRWYGTMDNGLTLAWRAYGIIVVGGPVPVYHRLNISSRLGVRGYNQRDYMGEDIVGGAAEVRLPLISPRFITFNFFDIYQFNTMRFGVYAAMFTDMGKIWFRSDDYDDVPWLASAGIGLHFLLPYSFVLRTELSVNALGQLRVAATGGVPF